jgi:hypothetical protein
VNETFDYTVNGNPGTVGRFMSPDRGSARGRSPSGWNRYGYVLDDPINHYDPRGRDSCQTGNEYSCDPGVIPFYGDDDQGGSGGQPDPTPDPTPSGGCTEDGCPDPHSRQSCRRQRRHFVPTLCSFGRGVGLVQWHAG